MGIAGDTIRAGFGKTCGGLYAPTRVCVIKLDKSTSASVLGKHNDRVETNAETVHHEYEGDEPRQNGNDLKRHPHVAEEPIQDNQHQGFVDQPAEREGENDRPNKGHDED